MSRVQTNRQPNCFIVSKEAESNPFLGECAACDWMTAISDQEQTHDAVVLTPHQKWFLSQNFPNPGHWNTVLELEPSIPLCRDTVQKTVAILCAKHEALRTNFIVKDGCWRQRIRPVNSGTETLCHFYDLSSCAPENARDEMTRILSQHHVSFSLATDCLVRFVNFTGVGYTGRLILIIHHIIFDAYSYFVLLRDFQRIYKRASQKKHYRLKAVSTTVVEWAKRLEDYVQSETFVRQFDYWKALPWHRLTPIPLDHPRQRRNNTIGSAAEATVCIENEALSVLSDGVRIKADVEKVLLAALLATFTEETGNPSWAFKVLNNGRHAVPFPDDYDLTRTIGPIAFSAVCFLECPDEERGLSLLKSVTEQLARTPNEGLGLELSNFCSHQKALSQRASAFLRQIDVLFNYVGYQSNTMSLFRRHWRYTDNTRCKDALRGDVLEITACTKDTGLYVRWEYSRNLHTAETIAAWTATYERHLRCILSDLSVRGDAKEMTPSRTLPLSP